HESRCDSRNDEIANFLSLRGKAEAIHNQAHRNLNDGIQKGDIPHCRLPRLLTKSRNDAIHNTESCLLLYNFNLLKIPLLNLIFA
ncbi:hypothetical protein, partial [Helicobacter rodentium]